MTTKFIIVKKMGTVASGNWGHAGRPGMVGGSSPVGKGGRQRAAFIANRVFEGNVTRSSVPRDTQRKVENVLNDGLVELTREYAERKHNYYSPGTEKWDDENNDTTRQAVKDDVCRTLAEKTGYTYQDVNTFVHQWAMSSNDTDMRSLSLQEAVRDELGLELSDWQKRKIAEVKREDDDFMSTHQAEYNANKVLVKEIQQGQIATYNSWVKEGGPDYAASQVVWSDYKLIDQNGKPRGSDVIEYEAKRMTYESAGHYIDEFRSKNGLFPRSEERALVRAMYDNTQEYLHKMGFKDGDTLRLYRGVSERPKMPSEDMSNTRRVREKDIIDTYNSHLGNAAESWAPSYRVAKSFGSGMVMFTNVPTRNIISTARTGWGCLNEAEFVIAGNVPGSMAMVTWAHDYDW